MAFTLETLAPLSAHYQESVGAMRLPTVLKSQSSQNHTRPACVDEEECIPNLTQAHNYTMCQQPQTHPRVWAAAHNPVPEREAGEPLE